MRSLMYLLIGLCLISSTYSFENHDSSQSSEESNENSSKSLRELVNFLKSFKFNNFRPSVESEESSNTIRSSPEESSSNKSSENDAQDTSTLGDCPMLYSRIGNRCIAIISVAKVSWADADNFCKSMFGTLIDFKTVSDFGTFLEHLKSSESSADFWIGGSVKDNTWQYTDGSPMRMGSPYWALGVSSYDSINRWDKREYVYNQAPFSVGSGENMKYYSKCAAMKYGNYYYFSDEDCQDLYSPVCVLREDAEIVVLKDWTKNSCIADKVTTAAAGTLTTVPMASEESSGDWENSGDSSEYGSGDYVVIRTGAGIWVDYEMN